VLLAAHATKAVARPRAPWPAWMEPVAVAMGVRLMHEEDAAAQWIGLAIVVGHCRQMLTWDDQYYGGWCRPPPSP